MLNAIKNCFAIDPPSRIANNLYQGGYPTEDEVENFDIVVFAAKEGQPAPHEFPNVEVIRAPLDDVADGPTKAEVGIAVDAANYIIDALRSGKRVLTTCMAGRNRSGLVNALVLVGGWGLSGHSAAIKVKARRCWALTNPGFAAFLKRVPAP